MATLKLDGLEMSTQADETVLETLLREGVEIPHSCRQGGCFSCVIFCKEGMLTKASQDGLSDDHLDSNGFFACLCTPDQDMTISLKQ